MDERLRVYGGFRLSGFLASKVQEAVAEISREHFGRDLSHADGDCPICVDAPTPDREQSAPR